MRYYLSRCDESLYFLLDCPVGRKSSHGDCCEVSKGKTDFIFHGSLDKLRELLCEYPFLERELLVYLNTRIGVLMAALKESCTEGVEALSAQRDGLLTVYLVLTAEC
jgi:hypothetical protein